MRNLAIFILLISVSLSSCVSDKVEGPVVSDATLFGLAQSVTSFTYYKNSLDTLRTDPTAAHSNYVRIRFNPKAREAMNSNMSGLSGQAFPDESMIVKEVYAVKGGPLTEFAIMYKLHNASNSSSGWVWAEI